LPVGVEEAAHRPAGRLVPGEPLVRPGADWYSRIAGSSMNVIPPLAELSRFSEL
jgi:hypothetical protein